MGSRQVLTTDTGIHGAPHETWNGVDRTVMRKKDAWNMKNMKGSNYCAHSSALFATWHRPYLALFEVSGWVATKIDQS
jgi:tyrosinase